ncbi:MAG: TIGR00701 family protein [Alteromonadaceae bacterium]|nr:MAG: TIGR00701 family protein [Alteromonadaceae bacterium]
MLVLKALHIISVVCWFAMLFYLPRLFVYHAATEDEAGKERFKTMERKLYRGIGTPSMIASLLFGAWTAHLNWQYYAESTWFWLKMALVIVLVGYHHICGVYVKKFNNETVNKSHIFFRWFNEFPVIILIVVVFLVVLQKPL